MAGCRCSHRGHRGPGHDDLAQGPRSRCRNRTAPRGRCRTSHREGPQAPDHPAHRVFPHPTKDTTPLALRANVEHNHVLHEQVLIVSVRPEGRAAREAERAAHRRRPRLQRRRIMHLTVRYGFFDTPTRRPRWRRPRPKGSYRPKWTPTTSYFLSRGALRRTDGAGMSRWRKQLFIVLAHNAGDVRPRSSPCRGADGDHGVRCGRLVEPPSAPGVRPAHAPRMRGGSAACR